MLRYAQHSATDIVATDYTNEHRNSMSELKMNQLFILNFGLTIRVHLCNLWQKNLSAAKYS